jgi:hypothetical protein
MILIGLFNGVMREATYGKTLTPLRAHQVSTLTGSILFGLYIWGLTLRWGLESAQQALIIGSIWLLLTVLFEFSFGRLVVKHSWSQLLGDYNLLAGRVWILVLIWIAIAPLVFWGLGSLGSLG